MNNNNSFLSKIITKQIIIDDDYIRKNYDGHKLDLQRGKAAGKTIIVFEYKLGDEITLINDSQKANVQKIIDGIAQDREKTVAHESQHIHNNAIGYSYLSNANNIYECMMLALADEMSAMMAGYMNKTGDVDKAMAETIDNLSGKTRQQYIQKQFAGHFLELQKVHGQDKNLFEHKFDTNKIHKILDYYFTIDGQKIMNNMSKQSMLLFGKFMVDIKTDINDFITQYKEHVKTKNNEISM